MDGQGKAIYPACGRSIGVLNHDCTAPTPPPSTHTCLLRSARAGRYVLFDGTDELPQAHGKLKLHDQHVLCAPAPTDWRSRSESNRSAPICALLPSLHAFISPSRTSSHSLSFSVLSAGSRPALFPPLCPRSSSPQQLPIRAFPLPNGR